MTPWYRNDYRIYRPFMRGIRWAQVDSLHKWPEIRIFEVSFLVGLNILLNKQSSCWWFETQWRSSDAIIMGSQFSFFQRTGSVFSKHARWPGCGVRHCDRHFVCWRSGLDGAVVSGRTGKTKKIDGEICGTNNCIRQQLKVCISEYNFMTTQDMARNDLCRMKFFMVTKSWHGYHTNYLTKSAYLFQGYNSIWSFICDSPLYMFFCRIFPLNLYLVTVFDEKVPENRTTQTGKGCWGKIYYHCGKFQSKLCNKPQKNVLCITLIRKKSLLRFSLGFEILGANLIPLISTVGENTHVCF